jgi:uncharacterized membrane protein
VSLAPLLAEPWYIQVHAFGAIAAFGLGLAQFAMTKGTTRHRAVGYSWVALMIIIALTSFFIHGIRLVGPFSPIHILSVITLYSAIAAVMHARAGRITAHKINMHLLFWAALVGAGTFAFIPPRLMGEVAFGG